MEDAVKNQVQEIIMEGIIPGHYEGLKRKPQIVSGGADSRYQGVLLTHRSKCFCLS